MSFIGAIIMLVAAGVFFWSIAGGILLSINVIFQSGIIEDIAKSAVFQVIMAFVGQVLFAIVLWVDEGGVFCFFAFIFAFILDVVYFFSRIIEEDQLKSIHRKAPNLTKHRKAPNLTKPSQTIDTFCTFKGDIHQLIDSVSVVYDEVKYYNEYQEELDNFLAHGVIPGVEVNTENCKKAFGMMYELFVGNFFEKQEDSLVFYQGMMSGKCDLGVDLFVMCDDPKRILVQCKYWRNNCVDEDVISRLCGARELYYFRNPDLDWECVIVTSSTLTYGAKKFANHQGIKILENFEMDKYSVPWVLGVGKSFYLPWDNRYWEHKLKPDACFFTVSEAIEAGFSRRGSESGGVILCNVSKVGE